MATGTADEEDVAAHAALARANATLLCERERLAERLGILCRAARDFAVATGDYPQLLDLVARRIGETIGDLCVVRMVGADGISIDELGGVYHPAPHVIHNVREIIRTWPLKVGEGIAGGVAATGKTVRIATSSVMELASRFEPKGRGIVEQLSMASMLVTALFAGGRITGIITLSRTRPGAPYTADDELFFDDLAAHASLALTNARLIEASRKEHVERMQTEEVRAEIEERNRKAQEANRLKGEFLANMSHELRTPLNAIIGFASLMHSGKVGRLADTHHEYMGDILTSSRHLLQLINDILDLAKVEAGKTELRIATVELRGIVGEVRDILRGLAAEKRISFETRVDAAVPAVEVDERMLKQILYNFLSNAIKFTGEGGRVALRISLVDDASFRADVEDTGIGIADVDMHRLFVEFQQLDSSMGKKYGGTGLGLALTKRLVEAHGGRVEVKSTPGVGSTFSAILPRRARPSTSPPSRRRQRDDAREAGAKDGK